jgi:acyl-CoA thioester hydrolase
VDYPYRQQITTRWHDNDIYGHVNNVDYYAFFDTVINTYLIVEGGLDIAAGPVIGLCAESHCTYHAAFTFPETIHAALRVAELRTRAVRYEIGLFAAGAQSPAAEGWFVHVFVDRASRRPTEIPPTLRAALESLSA